MRLYKNNIKKKVMHAESDGSSCFRNEIQMEEKENNSNFQQVEYGVDPSINKWIIAKYSEKKKFLKYFVVFIQKKIDDL